LGVHAVLPALASPELLGINWLDPQYLLNHFGDYALWGAAAIIFAECGLLIGFFLPGDSLLFTVGVLASQGHISYPLWLCCVVLTGAALLGNACGYAIGAKAGESVFHRRSSRLFKPEYVERTHVFFEKYGNRAVVLARFVPIVRTFITVMAGVGTMGFRRFMAYTAVGGVLWACGVTLLGFFLGQVDFLRAHIELLLLILVLVSVLPLVVEFLRHRAASKVSAAGDEG
jgi:membrane protein DedA with SNARE-associated domain